MTGRQVSHYIIGEALGGGAMGRVYRAEDTRLGRTVALKFLAPHLAADSAAVERFLREARLMAELDHRHICNVHDVDRSDEGEWFIAMALYDGSTLKDLLADGPLEPHQAADYARQTALGLAYAHDHGIIHRDIKPANLMVTDRGQIKILDFGIARLQHGTRHTQAGAVLGTVGYLAPEQTRGEEVTYASDIWSLGVVLFEMLTGTLPFAGDNPAAALYAIAHDDPATIAVDGGTLGGRCAAVVGRCLAKNPDGRYGSAREMAAELDRELRIADTAPTVATTPRRDRRNPRRVLLGALAGALLVLGIVFGPGWFDGGIDDTGVAVLPFTLVGGGEETADLGRGLASSLGDRLADADQRSDAFWLVPRGHVSRYAVADHEDAHDLLGAYRVVTGTGRVAGQDINLRLSVYDTRDGSRREEHFQDAKANLRTWQRDLATWVSAALGAEPVDDRYPGLERGCTTVPTAYLAYCGGLGKLAAVSGRAPPGASVLDRAVADFERAVDADSSFALARAELGYALWQRYGDADPDRAAEGRAHLETAARLAPGMARIHEYRGLVRAGEGRLDEALAVYGQGLALAPDDAPLLIGKARVLTALGRPDEAVSAYETMIAVRPGYAVGYVHLGVHHLNHGDLQLAEPPLRRFVALAPGSAMGYETLGTTVFNLRPEDPEAEDLYLGALAIAPSATIHFNLGNCYFYSHRYDDAAQFYRNAVDLEPGNYLYWQGLAEAYRWSPDEEEASQEAYERTTALGEELLAEYPDWTEATADVAGYHALLGNRDRALELLGRLEGAELPDGATALTVADAYEKLGRREDALAYVEIALDLGGVLTLVEEYPGFGGLRSDAGYRELITRHR